MRIPAGDLAPSRRRRRSGGRRRSGRRTGRAVVVGVVVLAATGAAVALHRDDRAAAGRVAAGRLAAKGAATAGPCAGPPGSPARGPAALPRPQQVRLVLYNGTPRTGLGKAVANQLVGRGFTVRVAGNAPPQHGTARVSFGPGASGSAQVLAEHVPGATLVPSARSPRGAVTLVLGDGFARLRTPAELVRRAPRAGPAGCR